MSEPQACPECLRRARLLAHLAPYIEKPRDRRAGGALARTAAALQRGPRRGRRAEGRRAGAESGRGGAGGQVAGRAGGGRVLGLLPPRRALPGRLARRRRRAVGADRPRRRDAAARAGARRCGDHRRRPSRQHLRSRGRPRAGPRARRRRADRGQRPGLRHRRLRPPRRARRRADLRGARLRRRRRLPGGAPLALAAGRRARADPLRAAAPDRRLALDLPGPQPDHGGAGGR